MAETVHLFIKTNKGQVLQGESTQTSLGREGSIECLSYHQSFASLANSTVREFGPITICKRIDRSSAELIRLCDERRVVEAEFRFFRPNPAGDGTTEQFFTVVIENAFVQTVDHSCSAVDDNRYNDAPLETISFSYSKIVWTYPPQGVSHNADVSQRR